jgi:hypothetical protein
VKKVTVADQMEQAIAGVQGAAANMKQFAQQTQDQQAKETFKQLSHTLDGAVETLRKRQQYIQSQEPQYRG